MIDRSEILGFATDLSLNPDIVEKDYVLGWLLAGIYAHSELAANWIFKGGTCLKKCYFETYRFSEDLDFTVTGGGRLDGAYLRDTFSTIGAWVYDQTGIEIPIADLRFDEYRNHRGGLCCQGRIYYSGPLGRRGAVPRIKLDLTGDEIIVLETERRPIGHPYSDRPASGFDAVCYSFEEVFGEKLRALTERGRPRDLYDVVNLFRNDDFQPDAPVVFDVLQQKCAFKAIAVPTIASLSSVAAELEADWQAMLAHQLPALPPFSTFWSALPEVFVWLESHRARVILAKAPAAPGEEVFRPQVGALRMGQVPGSSNLEAIRFAAGNHLCVDLTYGGSVRRIEPYSLRRTSEGNILVFAVRRDSGEARSYRLDRIEDATITTESFSPRFAVELSPTERGAIPSLSRSHTPSYGPRRSVSSGPTYVYECTYCGKKFRRKTRDSQLREHKQPGGYRCPGRRGYLVDTFY